MNCAIKKVFAREILDSRGNPTVEAEVTAGVSGKFVGRASVPSGASKGRFEAAELRDNEKRFLGMGVRKAVDNINKTISKKIIGMNVAEQEEIDSVMIELDGTENKSRLGANAILAVSIACTKASAAAEGVPVYMRLSELSKKRPRMPELFMNVINGGKHASNGLAFQEFMIVPKLRTFSDSLAAAAETYHKLKEIVERKFRNSAVGDEGGFCPWIKTAEEALSLLESAISSAGYENKIGLALDAAASNFYDGKKYCPRNSLLSKKLSTDELSDYYMRLIKSYGIISLEDPFNEEDFEGFAELTKKSKIQIVGDDLLATNLKRTEQAIAQRACNCLLLKPNQAGTLTETIKTAGVALKNSWKVMASHRSGETEDTFISDLAVGIGCGQIKAGAPCRGERTSKYNQLIRIREEIEK